MKLMSNSKRSANGDQMGSNFLKPSRPRLRSRRGNLALGVLNPDSLVELTFNSPNIPKKAIQSQLTPTAASLVPTPNVCHDELEQLPASERSFGSASRTSMQQPDARSEPDLESSYKGISTIIFLY
ncbi:unnamed protein product [Protopolystoma xenopodis]|uniref:Uncharacterized protein n=1 Tax=Protopolystoma xenopodis TaxID=117903 RepID=A0A448X3V6_9PLAT|nr:unnamed protein product [Protopolystoma xenopodis]